MSIRSQKRRLVPETFGFRKILRQQRRTRRRTNFYRLTQINGVLIEVGLGRNERFVPKKTGMKQGSFTSRSEKRREKRKL
uniref:Ribosomal protein S19 n=1 Tax=Acrobeloides nanus TaxID=290746 RepID=A0A914DP07_9BILA